MNNPHTQLTTQTNNQRTGTRALALLAADSLPQSPMQLLADAIYTGRVSPQMTGNALAADEELADVLKSAAVYRLSSQGVSPQGDFLALSVNVTPQDVGLALTRLQMAFSETRGALVREMAKLSVQLEGAPPQEREEEHSLRSVELAFARVNASYILVVSNAHGLLDRSPNYREHLSPVFRELLGCDPFLRELAPVFATLHGAHSLEAKKVAIKRFFETFCSEAEQPALYDAKFGSLVQTILLRELRQILTADNTLPATERKFAPYLAGLFEGRVRRELDRVLVRDSEILLVIGSLRNCAEEARKILATVTDYLLESSDSSTGTLTISEANATSCEVLLSVGCLLPETNVTDQLSQILYQVDDLNPALVLVFISALKFSLVDSSSEVQIDPSYLIQRGLSIASSLEPSRQRRLLDEVFLPLADDFALSARKNLDGWRSLPESLRAECINRILVRTIGDKQRDSGKKTSARIAVDTAISDLLFTHIENVSSKLVELNPTALRWLVNRGIEQSLTETQATKLVKILLTQESKQHSIGCTDGELAKLISIGGLSSLQYLAASPSHRYLFAAHAASINPRKEKERALVPGLVEQAIITPLKRALTRYDELATRVLVAEGEVYVAALQESDQRSLLQIHSKNTRHLEELTRVLEVNYDFLDAEKAYKSLVSKRQQLEEELSNVQKKSVRQLHAEGLQGKGHEIQKELERINARILDVARKSFLLPMPRPEGLSDYGSNKVSLQQLHELRLAILKFKDKVEAIQALVPTAQKESARTSEELRNIKQEVRELCDLAITVFHSPIVQTLDPRVLDFAPEGAGALLGLFCRANLVGFSLKNRSVESCARVRVELERDICNAIRNSVVKFGNHDDAYLILSELARLAGEESPLLTEWPEAESASDTATAYQKSEIPFETSLLEYLYRRLRSDLDNPEMSYLSNEPGWNESLHAPIIRIFSKILERRTTADIKRRAMKAVAPGVMYWANRVNQHNLAERDPLRATSSPIPVAPEMLLHPWSLCLAVSHGVGKYLDPSRVMRTCNVLVDTALSMLPTADEQLMKIELIPFYRNLKSAVSKHRDSVIFGKSELLSRYEAQLSDRWKKLQAEKRQNSESIAKELTSAIPSLERAQGVDFRSLAVAAQDGPLALPSPVAPTMNPKVARLSEQRTES